MVRTALISVVLVSAVAGAVRAAPQPDYVGPLTKLSQLASDGEFRKAIAGYKELQAQAGTPAWLRAAADFEIADLYGALKDSGNAIGALEHGVRAGYDDCLGPRSSEHLATVVKDPRAAKALAGMRISEADLRELAWLKQEVEHAEHDARLMITDNINRVDQQSTEIPQAQLPTRATGSPAVMYWRQQLLLIQRAQREFVKSSDEERMVHAATMGVVSGSSTAAALESARQAHATAESRRAAIRKRAFVPSPGASTVPRACPVATPG
jgi:hypothetical protein